MAAGDSVTDHDTIANGSYMDIHPGSAGVEWMVQNLYMGGAWELYRTDGTNEIRIDNGASSRTLQGRSMIATYTEYFRIKNVSGGSAYFGYDGRVIA